MPDFKDLHNQWKKAKGKAKDTWDHWSGMYMTVKTTDVEYGTPPWPKFNLDLGPSLDKIRKGKDVEKSKTKVRKALTQYRTSISEFCKKAKKVATGDDRLKSAAQILILKKMGKLETVLQEIEDALNE